MTAKAEGEGEASTPRRKRRRRLAVGAVALLAPNVFAAAHAWALTHYARGGERPRPPQELTAGERLQRLLLGVRIPRPEDDARIDGRYFRRFPQRRLLLHGVSQGAAACLRAVARHGAQVDGLVLESCYGRLTDTVRARVRLMGAPASPGAELLVLRRSVLGGFDGFGLAPVEDAAAAAARGLPALVLHGDADPTVPVEAARELTGALGPRARLVLIPGAGHVSLLGAAPEAWEAATTALLDEVCPP